jgi:lysophospholipase L1-like esterase
MFIIVKKVGIMGRKHKNFLLVSISINVIGVMAAALMFVKIGGFSYFASTSVTYNENPYFIERTALFNAVSIPEGSTVFVGDSITQRALWNELFPGENVINRGINSDTTEGVKNRMEEITKSKPERVLMMIGVNDLYAGQSPEKILLNYRDIINQLKTKSPNAEVYIQSVLPLNYEMYFAKDKIKNETIQNLNAELKSLSVDMDAIYIDLYPLYEKNNQMNPELTYDGIHLNGEGYNIWKKAIKGYIN